MAELFETLKLNWEGRDYEVMPTLEIIARVENVITGGELFRVLNGGGIPFAKISMAYGVILRAAGCVVDDGEIYRGMFSTEEDRNQAANAVAALLAMMAPSSDVDIGADDPKKPKPKAPAKRQKKSTKS